MNFDINKIDFEDIYDGLERRNRHNLILSLEDGIFNYHFNFYLLSEDERLKFKSRGVDTQRSSNIQYPILLEANCKHNFIPKTENNYYIKEFLSYVHSGINSATILNLDIRSYYRDFDRMNTLFLK